MHQFIHAGHRIFDEHDMESLLGGAAGGGFDAEIGSDAAEHNGINAELA